MGIIVTGGAVSSSITTRVYKSDTGEAVWTANHGDTVFAVAVDADGNVYTAGRRTSNITTRKYNNTGVQQWTADHGDTVWGLALDSNGNVYTVGNVTSSTTTRKYDNDGNAITSGWPVNHGRITLGVAIDDSDNVYTCGLRNSTINVRKYNSGGTQQWTADNDADLECIATVGTNFAAGGAINSSTRTTRVGRNSDGVWLYAYNHAATVRGIARGYNTDGTPNSYVATIGSRNASNITTRYFPSTTGSDYWTADHGNTGYGICLDTEDGSIYTCGAVSSSVTTRKYTYNGTEITSDNWPLNHGGTTYKVAFSTWTPNFTSVPALSLPLGLATPIATFSHQIPSIVIAFSLGLPDSTPIPLPPDLAGVAYPPQQIYRAFLTGGASLLELPMSGLQCRRRLGESTWLDVEIPTYSTALAAEIAGVATRELVIYAGYLIDGTETLGEMMRATLTEIRDEREGGRGSMRLTARVIPATATVTSHQLTGVRQRGRDEQGRRTITCAVNPLVRPNHTVNDGLYTFAVGSMTYRIDPTNAVMWLVESS